MPYIDNADLMPPYVPDNEVALEPSDGGTLLSPAWVKTLIIAQASIASAAEDGTFQGATNLLAHYREMGVNGLWLTPVYAGDHYGNHGLHTIDKKLVGTDDYKDGLKVIGDFVGEAHRRDIRVFIDVVSWGTRKDAPLHDEKPEWYTGEEEYGGWCWDWHNPELNAWFTDCLVHFIDKTGADGFRCDCAPGYCGYEPYRAARQRLLGMGRKIALISESASGRQSVFDFDEHHSDDDEDKWNIGDSFIRKFNIVDTTKTGYGLGMLSEQTKDNGGLHRFYAFLISCHDSKDYQVKQSPIVMGYQALFAPYIPMWYIGEEWDNNYHNNGYWLYGNTIDWSLLKENRNFYELTKKMIRIRRENANIFEYFPDNHREANICKVQTDHKGALQAYARYGGGKGILIVPNHNEENERFNIQVPFADMKLDKKCDYTVTDLFADTVIDRGTGNELDIITVCIPQGQIGIFLVT